MFETILTEQYGLTPLEVRETPGGFSARAFLVKTAHGQFFFKVYEKSRPGIEKYTAGLGEQLEALAFLWEQLEGQTSHPLPCLSGSFFCEDSFGTYVLFDWIDGNALGFGKEYNSTELQFLARIVQQIHCLKTIPSCLNRFREDFSLPCCDKAEALLPKALKDPILAPVLTPSLQKLEESIRKTRALAEKLRQNPPPFVLCHTDIHGGNIMSDGHKLWLIDWEGILLAPREADLFMLDTPAFFEAYDANYQVDKTAMEFYRCRRLVDDVYEFLLELLRRDIPKKEYDRSLFCLKSML